MCKGFLGNDYSYGFNGQEKVDEIAGVGNHNTALFWEYDTRLGRRWNVDPKGVTGWSGYSAFMDCPTLVTDIYGDSGEVKKTIAGVVCKAKCPKGVKKTNITQKPSSSSNTNSKPDGKSFYYKLCHSLDGFNDWGRSIHVAPEWQNGYEYTTVENANRNTKKIALTVVATITTIMSLG
jgi:hypothetical protein